MTIWVAQVDHAVGAGGRVDAGDDGAETIQHALDVCRLEPRLNMPQVFWLGVVGAGPSGSRRQVVKELHARTGSASERGNADPGAGHAAQPFLLGAPVLTSAQHVQAEPVAVERKPASVEDTTMAVW